MKWKNIVISVVVLALMAALIVPQIASALDIRHSYQNNPATTGSSNRITFTIENTETQQIYVKGAEVTWEWRTTPYVESGLNVPIATGASGSVTIDFDVPENVPTTTQSGTAIIYYTIGSSSGPQLSQTQIVPLRVVPPINFWFWMLVIVIIAVVIIVISVVYLYVKKKPQVHVHKHVKEVQKEKEEPKTRIRMAPQRGAGGATEIVGAGGVTQVMTPEGGLEVVFPKGGKKIVQNELIIGRQDFGNLVDSSLLQRISKNHCRIYEEGGNYYIEDGYRGKASTNGTKINGREIRGAGPHQITVNTTISIADAADLQVMVRK